MNSGDCGSTLNTKEIESRFHLEYVYHRSNEGPRCMNFTRTLLLSTVVHTGLVFVLVNHRAPDLKPLMTKPDLAHYVKVRLQLPALVPEAVTEPVLVEESSEEITTKTSVTHKRAKLATARPKLKKAPKQPTVPSPIVKQSASKVTTPVKLVNSGFSVDKTIVVEAEQTTTSQVVDQTLNPSTRKLTRKERRTIKRAYWSRLTRFFKSTGYSYPKRAILAGQEGKVYIVIEIDPSGLIIDASISKSSGFPVLDASALQAVLATKRVPPLPIRINQKNRKFRIPIEYRLPS